MLPAAHRLRDGADFSAAVRRGARGSTRTLTVHLRSSAGDAPVRVGLTVGRTVGGAVVRTGVKRRLRHQAAGLLGALPAGSQLVIRAHPAAADADSERLRTDLERALERAQATQVSGARA